MRGFASTAHRTDLVVAVTLDPLIRRAQPDMSAGAALLDGLFRLSRGDFSASLWQRAPWPQ
jgi:hypothetical protein